MTIEWGGLGLETKTTSLVQDPGGAPERVIDDNTTFTVKVTWDVPPGLAPYLGGQFRLRCFAESVGQGQEQQIGNTEFEPVVPGKIAYSKDIAVPAGQLRGEGQLDPVTGDPVSGMYRVATVVQHLNPGATPGCGFSEETLIQVRTP